MASGIQCDANHPRDRELTSSRLVGPEVASRTAFEEAEDEDADEAGPLATTTETEDVILTSGSASRDFERTGVGNAIATVTATENGTEGIIDPGAHHRETSASETEMALPVQMRIGHVGTPEMVR